MIKEDLRFIWNFLKIFSFFICFLSLNSCADSEVAKKLANSFDSPLENSNSKTLVDQTPDKKTEEEKLLVNPSLANSNVLSNKKRTSFMTKSEKKIIQKKNSNSNYQLSRFNPQPYRIILRLSGANPSAPAETVTKALREAGVIFEVEKIERFEKDTLPQSGIRERD